MVASPLSTFFIATVTNDANISQPSATPGLLAHAVTSDTVHYMIRHTVLNGYCFSHQQLSAVAIVMLSAGTMLRTQILYNVLV